MDRNFVTNSGNPNPYPNTLARSLAEAQIERVRCSSQPPSAVQIRPRSRLLHSLSTQEQTCLELSEPNLCDYCRQASVPRPPGYAMGSYPPTVNNPAELSITAEDIEGMTSGMIGSAQTEQKREPWPLASDCVFYIISNADRLIGPFLFTSVPSKFPCS
ncbi:hypothetical protein FGIG_10951 [Fasciola gigantica]|uniref:Uncharacterized protein n=1 Tax=Fasciola gigantica TaxID=46835 RepID=A0A504YAL3_FASGI|nr:hypothetical protein FGIG_10951 [Fasciola gigantica]